MKKKGIYLNTEAKQTSAVTSIQRSIDYWRISRSPSETLANNGFTSLGDNRKKVNRINYTL